MDNIRTEAVHREMQLKKEIEKKDKTIKQDKEKSKLDVIKNVKRKEVQ